MEHNSHTQCNHCTRIHLHEAGFDLPNDPTPCERCEEMTVSRMEFDMNEAADIFSK